jgi:pimeloyl-ACP methyl ester carboxylesterase
MVTFATADGLTLQGRLYPGGTTWVLLAHMFPADMTSWFDFAAAAQQAGFSALAYNNRGYGGSDPGSPLDVGADAAAALAFARANGADAVFFFGASMNGAAALFLAAGEDLAGIASLSGVPEWDNTPGLERAPGVVEPALFVAAEDDGGAVESARLMADAVGGPSEVVVYPTGGHGTDMFGDNPGLTDLLLDFIRQHS